jgi:nucleoside-diphosphate-sugar epimerase
MFNQIINQDINYILGKKHINWRALKNKKFLISGANSFIANYIIYLLIYLNTKKKFNIKIHLLVRSKKSVMKKFITSDTKKFIKIIEKDITSKFIYNDKVDYILHLASNASPKFYAKYPIETALPNILGTYNLLRIKNINNIKSFLFFSSGEVYGISKNILHENRIYSNNNLNLRASYSESKKMGETLCYSFFKQKKIPIKIIRLFHTYGPCMNLNDGRVMMDFVRDSLCKKKITIKSNGNQKRTFLYIADAISGIFTILLKGKSGEAYNLGNCSEILSIKSLAQLFKKLVKNIKIVYKERNRKERYQQSKFNILIPSTAKIAKLGFKANIKSAEGFSRTINYFRQISN